ncbi:MAG: rhomboid family intramembrane serine protease [Myxococcales bacterium]|nr:rhomboid family intramembrane serine protease [Myxococcales bacterium]
MILPIGLEDSRVNRVPWVSIGIAAATVLIFLFTWVFRPDFEEGLETRLEAVLDYWAEHPYLELDPALRDRFDLPKSPHAFMDHQAPAQREPPGEEQLAREQARLDEMAGELLLAMDSDVLRRLSIVPARGALQIGWLSSMFLHFGWLHLLGNLLFFYVVGAFLEDVWGRPMFLGFYLAGGLVAGVCQAILDLSSQTMILGASGAVAACMGAFAFRFPARRVNFVYWIGWFFRGTFRLPAWVWGAVWFSLEVLQFVLEGDQATVAFMAHIGGFLFGVAVAVGLKAWKWEEKVAPELDTAEWKVDPQVERAQQHLSEGRRDDARKAFRLALAKDPNDPEALLGLARLELEDGARAEASGRVRKVLSRYDSQGNTEGIKLVVQDLGAKLDLAVLPHQLAVRIARMYEQDDWRTAARLLDAAGQAGGVQGAEALLRAAELRLDHRSGGEIAFEQAREAARMVAGAPHLLDRARELEHRARALLPDLTPPSETAGAAGFPSPGVRECQLLSLTSDRVRLQLPGGPARELLLRSVVAVCAGRVPQEGSMDPRGVLVLDLVVKWGAGGAGPELFRVVGVPGLSLPSLFPGVPGPEAYGRLIHALVEATGASCLPSREAVSGRPFATYADLQAFEAACYGRVG